MTKIYDSSVTWAEIERAADPRLVEQLRHLQSRSPELFARVDLGRVAQSGWTTADALADQASEFESSEGGGRGTTYRDAQRNPLVRAVGIRQLFEALTPTRDLAALTPDHLILDVLGGDGLLTRALSRLTSPETMPAILTSDLAQNMVAAAQAYGLPALRQPAQDLLLKNASFDGVVIAYGTHHIPPDERQTVCTEAYRVLQSGGCIVFQDYDNDSNVAHWFHDVVDLYAINGHDIPHFSADEVARYLDHAGFSAVTIEYHYDPLCFTGDSPAAAEAALGHYLLKMYGLVRLTERYGYEQALSVAVDLARACFDHDPKTAETLEPTSCVSVETTTDGNRWKIEVPRVALVGVAVKPE